MGGRHHSPWHRLAPSPRAGSLQARVQADPPFGDFTAVELPLHGVAGQRVVLESSYDLQAWQTLQEGLLPADDFTVSVRYPGAATQGFLRVRAVRVP